MQCDGQKVSTSGALDSSVGRAPDQIQGYGSKSWSLLSLFLPSHYIWYLDQVLKLTGLKLLQGERSLDVDLQGPRSFKGEGNDRMASGSITNQDSSVGKAPNLQ